VIFPEPFPDVRLALLVVAGGYRLIFSTRWLFRPFGFATADWRIFGLYK